MISLLLNEAELAAYTDVEGAFDREVADLFISSVRALYNNSSGQIPIVTAAMLTLKSVLCQYVENAYPEGGEKVPVDLANTGYYLEQCLASLCQHYVEKKKEQPQLIL